MAQPPRPTRRAVLQGGGALAMSGPAFGRRAAAAGYPERTVRIVVPFAAGARATLRRA